MEGTKRMLCYMERGRSREGRQKRVVRPSRLGRETERNHVRDGEREAREGGLL